MKALRERRGWTQYQLAVASRLAPATIHKIETGKTVSPRVDALQSIAAALGVTTEELMRPEMQTLNSLPENDWRRQEITDYAPNTPPDQARLLLETFDRLSGAQREAAILLLTGLFKGERGENGSNNNHNHKLHKKEG